MNQFSLIAGIVFMFIGGCFAPVEYFWLKFYISGVGLILIYAIRTAPSEARNNPTPTKGE